MSILRLMGKIFSFLALNNVVRNYQRKSSLMKIKAVKVYVLGVKKIRLFFIGAMLLFTSLVLLASGIFLINTAFFTYSNWTINTKFNVALILGVVEAFSAAGILFYLFREETWVRFTGINTVVNAVIEKETKTMR